LPRITGFQLWRRHAAGVNHWQASNHADNQMMLEFGVLPLTAYVAVHGSHARRGTLTLNHGVVR
jgi:hypothetical protein